MYVHIYTYINVLHIYLQLICLQTLWHNSYLWSRRRRRRRLVVIASRLAHTAYECSYKKRYAPAKKKKNTRSYRRYLLWKMICAQWATKNFNKYWQHYKTKTEKQTNLPARELGQVDEA